VSLSKDSPFKLDTFVVLPWEKSIETDTVHNIANTLQDCLVKASDYHWSELIQCNYLPMYWMGIQSKDEAGSTVVTYFCAQLEGKKRTQRLHKDPAKQRGWVQMPRYNCEGWLYITMPDDRTLPVWVWMSHEEAHPHYTDILLPEHVL
jgi:hypothetical protein